ncbi:LysR family transcriptional regulator [Streptacidiphilus sp. P02-A3a]|uniref:LysR family transcriptional regulator n=1 Tax=Streptacidiphilus sp. P02-A3a TaxID=2704468 RepID=UPI0015FB6A7C|nr:LysR family transcriptional regulator [Streptacidiphilus sp. P02-A3a]QMU71465.1 LysR family transcriptional regulator [Streptacidiphilus sp. P02-A3a]
MQGDFHTAHLRVFRAVVTSGSFTAAAADLGISQPAVSQHIARLERSLGVSLLHRSGGPVRVTESGEVVLRLADAVAQRCRQAMHELSALADPVGGELQIAAFPSASGSLLPTVVGRLRQVAPQARVRIIEADPPAALPCLLRGEADLALVYDYPYPDRDTALGDGRLLQETLASDPMAVAVPAGHPLAALPSIPLGALRQESWATPRPSVCQQALGAACRDAGFRPAVVYETENYHSMLGLVATGAGVAVVPRLAVLGGAPPRVALRPLTGTWLRRTMAVATRADSQQPPLSGRFRSLLRQAAPELLAAPL